MDMNEMLKLQIECTAFFEQNPYTFETINGLENRIGRPTSLLQPILDELVSMSILNRSGEGDQAIYHYIPPIEIGIEL
jgi:hypothetical protein